VILVRVVFVTFNFNPKKINNNNNNDDDVNNDTPNVPVDTRITHVHGFRAINDGYLRRIPVKIR